MHNSATPAGFPSSTREPPLLALCLLINNHSPFQALPKSICTMPTSLSPTQQQTFDRFLHDWPLGHILCISGDTGMGKSTLLRAAHAQFGGAFLSMRELLDAMPSRLPLALEETFDQLLR